MTLVRSLEKNGNWLFRYRGQIPYLLFLLVIPVIYFTDYDQMPRSMIITVKLIAVFVWLLGLAVRVITIGTASRNTSGRNREEQVADTVNTTGIYSTVRHPLYLGNYLMWAGITIYVVNLPFFLIVSLLYWIYYERIMFAEERFLERKFGDAYVNWASRTPAFIPSFKNYIPGRNRFSIREVLKKEYSGVLATAVSILFIQILQDSFGQGHFVYRLEFLIITAAALLLAVILRFIRKRYWQ